MAHCVSDRRGEPGESTVTHGDTNTPPNQRYYCSAAFYLKPLQAVGQSVPHTAAEYSNTAVWVYRGASSASDCVALQARPVKGAPCGRVAKAMAQAPPLTVLSFQAVSGSYRTRHPYASAS